ncbi:putative cyanate ABC transporter, substrate binding protein [Thalassoporum mexicanum PCC 7367]|nr:putative cyanate ABC transporter, substrate binding protein [Pseudanabaena sp. PCC 7367]
MVIKNKGLLDSTATAILDRNACPCGQPHSTADHWQFANSMPTDPVDLTADLAKMSLIKPEAFSLADRITVAEMREALFFKQAGRGNSRREKLCRDLAAQAGGLSNAMAAAFGPQAGIFFGDVMRKNQFTRRRFLRNVSIGAALVTLASCGSNPDTPPEATVDSSAVDGSNLEKTTLRVGFIPITCATPILMAGPLGLYEKHGLEVELVKLPSWAAVRDAMIAGELDASHLIAPMPITMTLGLGSAPFDTRTVTISNLNGNAITVANRHKETVKGPADFKGFRIALPFPHSTHTLLLRYYLATGGLNPDTDVQLDVVPPADTVAQMAVGELDAMLIAEPFNQRLVAEGAGYIHMLSKEIWPGHPCCILSAGQEWIDTNPNTFDAMTKAVLEASYFAKDKSNRPEIAQTLASRQFLNQPEDVLQSIYTGKYDDGNGNTQDIPDRVDFDPYPWKSFAYWLTTQMVRWDYVPGDQADYNAIGDLYLTEVVQRLGGELGLDVPTDELRSENLLFDAFDPSDPDAYLNEQIETYGV